MTKESDMRREAGLSSQKDPFFENLKEVTRDRPEMPLEERFQMAATRTVAARDLGDPSLADIVGTVEADLSLSKSQWDRLQPLLDTPKGMVSVGEFFMRTSPVWSKRYEDMGYDVLAVGLDRWLQQTPGDPREILAEITERLRDLTQGLLETEGKEDAYEKSSKLYLSYCEKESLMNDVDDLYNVVPLAMRPKPM